MALRRVVQNAARSMSMVGHQLNGGKGKGFLGAINSGLDNYSYLNNCRISHFLSFSRRHYYLPPPPPVIHLHEILEGFLVFAVDNPEKDDKANEYAQFAVKTHNEASQDGGEDHVRFVRLVRAWTGINPYYRYRMMLEAVDGKGELNLYYADVIDRPKKKLTELSKWELVDQSFSYPFDEYSWGRESTSDFAQHDAYSACPTLTLDTISSNSVPEVPCAARGDLHKNEFEKVN